MSSSRTNHKRILRVDDGVKAATASLIVDMGGTGNGGATGINGMLAQARREGYDEGYQVATSEMAAAEAAGRAAQLRRVADALAAAAADAREARHAAVAVAASEATELAYELAAAFLQRELTVGRPVIEAVTRALALVPEDEDLTVRVNPADPVSTEEIAALVPEARINVVADPRVEAGGCVVQAGPCRIDTQLGAALERVRSVLADAYPDSAAAARLAVVEEVA